MTKIVEAAMGLCHEPDVPAPDAVPNAVPHALPLLRNRPEGSTWPPWPQVSPHFWFRAKSDTANCAWQTQLRCLSLWSATCVYITPCPAPRPHVCLFVSANSS